ncbi:MULTISPECIES: LysR family transcriptional regulator [Rhodobacterales]|uniref:LysR family transcriptional regulator n=1 Tax=Ascidiaceihabitans sp. TaxID=1872644 RepID=UPI003299F7B7
MQPEPKHILSFKTALTAGTIRAAADQLGLEPSTVSRNIASLEKQLATALIERGRKGVLPTEAGLLLLDYAQRQSGEMEALRSQLDALANMERGAISIALGEGFVSDFSQSVLEKFSRDHTEITFSLNVGSTDQTADAVIEDRAHIGLAFDVAPNPRLNVIAQADRSLVVVCQKGGKFDAAGEVKIADFSGLPCAFLNKGYGVGAVIADMEASHGFRARAVMETGSIAALKAFVRSDLGITLLPEFVVADDINAGNLRARAVAVSNFGSGKVSLFVRQGRRLPLAAQKLIPIMSRSLVALNN